VKTTGALAALMLLTGCVLAPVRFEREFSTVEPVGTLAERVSATIRIEAATRRVGRQEGLRFELRLANISRSLTRIRTDLRPGRLVLIEVVKSNGTYRRSPAPAKHRRDRDAQFHHATLQPGAFVGGHYVLRPADPIWRLEPGHYRVRVIYGNYQPVCPASPGLTEADIKLLGEKAVVRVLTGMIASNVEPFEVVGD